MSEVQVGRVGEIHRYPVKSMQGERLGSVEIADDGLHGDRGWAVRDEGRGGIEGARKLPALLECSARLPASTPKEGPAPEIALPDGRRLAADDPTAGAALSDLAGRELSLWPRRPATDESHYRRGAADHEDIAEELRAIFGRLPEEPLPDIARFPPEILASATLPGTYFDVYPVFALSRTSLATLQAAKPDSRFDVRRFRPNLLLDLEEAAGFP